MTAVTRYLLQDVSAVEQEDIERQYFADPDFLAEVEAVEGDLIDAYVRGELTAADRERFEKYFLRTRGRRERVRIAEARFAWIEPEGAQAKPRRWPMLAAAAALLVVIVGGSWLWRENRRPQIETVRTAPQPPAPVTTPTATVVPAPVVASIVLIPGVTRDDEPPQRLVVPKDADFVRLRPLLEVDGDLRSLSASLRGSTGEVWRGTRLVLEQDGAARMLTLLIPADRLATGQYLLTVSAEGEGIADYAFVLER